MVAMKRRRVDRSEKYLRDEINNSSWVKHGGVKMTAAVIETKLLNETKV